MPRGSPFTDFLIRILYGFLHRFTERTSRLQNGKRIFSSIDLQFAQRISLSAMISSAPTLCVCAERYHEPDYALSPANSRKKLYPIELNQCRLSANASRKKSNQRTRGLSGYLEHPNKLTRAQTIMPSLPESRHDQHHTPPVDTPAYEQAGLRHASAPAAFPATTRHWLSLIGYAKAML